MTQLSAAKAGEISAQMKRVAQREGQSPEFIRDEIAAGRLVIPANPKHLAGKLDPAGIGGGIDGPHGVPKGVSRR